MVMELDQENLCRLEALESALDQVAKEGMSQKKLQQLQELALGEIAETIHRSLMGAPSAKVIPNKHPDKTLRAVTWNRVSLPALALLPGPLQELLDGLMTET